ncbi:MAG: helix-turn-helix domain-containing protein [Eubacteriales bacterium]|nr:helix-turn-helix domain-containing protein [Eubacteriales bacterium]
MDKQFYTMKELAELMPLGTTNLYNLVHSAGFPSIVINRKILIPVDGFEKWVKTSAGKKITL